MDYPFRSDGCSVVLDLDMYMVCLKHDWAYWAGGTSAERKTADLEFYRGILNRSKYPWLAPIRYYGVRIGGVSWLPFRKWRWGYGWKWPKAQATKPDNSRFTQIGQLKSYYALMRAAEGEG